MTIIVSSPHRNMNRLWSFIISLIDSSMEWFFLSTTSLCWGLCGTINSLLILTSLQKVMSSLEEYSPSLSNLNIYIFYLVRRLTLVHAHLSVSDPRLLFIYTLPLEFVLGEIIYLTTWWIHLLHFFNYHCSSFSDLSTVTCTEQKKTRAKVFPTTFS